MWTDNSLFAISVRRLLCAALLSLFSCVAANGQDSSTDGTTPPYLTPGAPAGSYSLSGFENLNLFNGNLNFSLPLVTIGGRGAAGHTVSLDIEQRWRTKKYGVSPDGFPAEWIPVGTWWGGLKRGYGPGVMEGRRGGYYYSSTDWCGEIGTHFFQQTLTHLTFTGAGGTEFELRDQQTGGRPALLNETPCNTEFSRGSVFITADGSAATFISDAPISDYKHQPMGNNQDQFTPSGFLMLKDGARYRIDNGLVSWIRDRNGNKLSFTYDMNKRMISAMDSLNRQVTITYNSGTGYDLISYKGSNGATREIKVWYASLSSPGMLISGQSVQTLANLFPELLRASSFTTFDPLKVSYVELPDQRIYRFRYNKYGELARVELPTGGVYEYDWASGFTTIPGGSGSDGEAAVYRRVTARRVWKDTSTLENKTIYSVPDPGVGGNAVVTVEVKDAGDVLLAKSIHTFHGQPWYSAESYNAVSYPAFTNGREKQTDVYNIVGSSPVLQRQTITTWVQRAAVSWWTGNPDQAPPNDPRIIEADSALIDSNQVSKQTFNYDQYNNQTDVYEYDFGAGAPGALVRRTHTDYLTVNPVNGADYAGDANVHLRGLPSQQSVYDSGGNERARTTYEYDNYANDANHASLVDRPGIFGLDSGFTTAYTKRGNITRVSRFILANTGLVGSDTEFAGYSQYDIAGNVVKTKDPKGNVAQVDYSSTYQFAYPTTQTSPVPDASGYYASSTAFTTTTNYDFWTGKVTSSTDANSQTTTAEYNDALDRLSRL